MEFTQVVCQRHVVSNFTSEPVPSETVDRILDLTRRDPSSEAAYHRRCQELEKTSISLKLGCKPQREIVHREQW